jgi:N-acetylmuramoyl-L-alanine amidase
MLKKVCAAGGLITLMILCVSLVKPYSVQQKTTIHTVIIDPGHGGKDPGARGLISTEAQVALQISLKLGQAFQDEFPNIKLVFTRTTDVLPGNSASINQALRYRADMANQAKGDLFICIHCNSAGLRPGGWYAKRIVGSRPKTVYIGKGRKRKKRVIQEPIYQSYYVKNETHGTETYVWAADRSSAKSEYVPFEEGGGGEEVSDSLNVLDLNSPEARIRASLYTKYFFDRSALMAKYVEDAFVASGRTSRGVLQRNNKGIWVLQATGMPSLLIETGFISNKEEEEYLNSNNGQAEIVENIMSAFRKYKQDVENPRRTPAATKTTTGK